MLRFDKCVNFHLAYTSTYILHIVPYPVHHFNA